jgi:hypothetical protein
MRLPKADSMPMALACDTAITVLEAKYELPPGVKKGEVDHALTMLRTMRSRLLRANLEPEETPNGNAK